MTDQDVYGWGAPRPGEPQGWQQVGAPAPQRGVSLSTAGAVAAALGLLLVGALLGAGAVVGIGMLAPVVPMSLLVGAQGDVATLDLAPGDCASGVLDVAALPATPQAVACDEAHEVEVYAVAEALPDGGYPDAAALDSYAIGWCELAFEGYVGVDYWSSELEMWPVMPDGDAWRDGERRIACLASTVDGSLLERSVAGTAR